MATDFKILPTVNGTAVALDGHSHVEHTAPATTPSLWLDASDITGLSDGGAVASWPDSSGNGLHAVQGTAGKRPTYKTNIVSGRPVVRFDGGDTLVCPAFGAALTVPYTTFVVCQVTLSTLSGGNQYLVGSFDVGDHGLVYARDSDNTYACYSGAALSAGVSTDAWAVVAATFNGASSSIQVNATLVGGNAGSDTLGRVGIGSNRDIDSYLVGDIAEVIVYDRTLAAAEVQETLSYLDAKYSLPGSYDVADVPPFATLTRWGTD